MLAFFIAVSLLVLSCGKSAEPQIAETQNYASFLEIPNVTQEEIEAIETIKTKREFFTYGMNESTEAFYGENGEINGYAALLCKYLSELFGIPFKPVIYEWNDLLTNLKDGNIDFTGEITATEERLKSHYMTTSIVERSIIYFRMKGAAPLEEIAKQRHLRNAFLSNSIIAHEVSPFIKEDDEIIFVSNYKEAYNMLKNGQIDVFFDEDIAEAAFDIHEDVEAKNFNPLIYNPVSMSTKNPELKPIISVVQKMLESNKRGYLTELHKNGQLEYSRHKLFKYSLSRIERKYINENPAVLVVADRGNYPVSFYNTHEKQWQGIFFDVLKEIESLIGLSFIIAHNEHTEWPVLLQMLEHGNASVIAELIPSEDKKDRFIWTEHSLLQDKYALISKESFPSASTNEVLHFKVGLLKGTAHTELFKIWFPYHPNTMEYEGSTAAFNALRNDEIDMLMVSQNMLLALTNYMELPNYKINVLFDRPFEVLIGLNKDEFILRSIMDKTLSRIDIKKIAHKWILKTFDYRVKQAESRLPVFIGLSILLLSVIVLLLVLHNRILNEERKLENLVQERTAELDEQRKQLEYMSLTDQLTNIPNRRNFDNKLNSEWRRAIREKAPISLLMLDIDKFKLYNDTHGHQEGDEVLKAVAKSLENTVKRPGDLVARWGGEEFAVLLPCTNSAGALEIAESIRKNVEKTTMATISVGVTTTIPKTGDSIDLFISTADNALYKAKGTGRNRVCVL